MTEHATERRARRSRLRALACALFFVLAAAPQPPPARADDGALAAAEAAYARGALREANRLFLASLRQPGHERDALVRIHVHLGILAGATGAERTARNHFAIALAIDPAVATPTELAGRDRSRFEQERPAHGLSVAVERDAEAGASASSFVVRVWHAPPRLVRSIGVRCGEAQLPTTPLGRGSELSAVRVAASCPGAVAVTLLDEHGGALLRYEHAVPTQAEVTP